MVQSNKKIDISVNITAHKEGILLYKTLRSIDAGIKLALAKKIKIEVNLSLDCANELTTRVAKDFAKTLSYKINIFEINKGDLGLSRNYLISKSSGKYIAFFDGDDFFTENYLLRAFELAEKSKKPAVYVARYIVCFDSMNYITTVLDSSDSSISKRYFFETNYYISQNFVHRKIYEQIQYHSNKGGYGFEDWHFNCEALSAGHEFITIPSVVFYYRRKSTGSLLLEHTNESILYATSLFERDKFINLPAAETPIIKDLQEEHDAVDVSHSTILNSIKNKLHTPRQNVIARNLQSMCLISIRGLRNAVNKLREQNHDETQTAPVTSKQSDVLQKFKEIGVSKEAIKYWGVLNQYEPMIHPSRKYLESLQVVDYPKSSALSDAYYQACKKTIGKRFTDIVLVPHMVRGGAELATIHLVSALSEQGRSVLVLSTLDSGSPWRDKVNNIKNATFLEGKQLFKHIPDQGNRQFLAMRIIQNWGIKNISIINSEVGYMLAIKYQKILDDLKCKIFLHTYAFDVTEDGYIFNYIQNGLTDAYKSVTQYVTDSNIYKQQLMEVNGFKDSDITPLYMPINTKIIPKKSYKKTKKILYAGRICSQKIADVAVQVGVLLAEHGIELHFYGNIDHEYELNDRFLNMIEGYPTIQYKGVYEGFGTLELDSYDMFLLTTRTEGMANVILEACIANIYIVSASVGGLSECIINNENGYLVMDKNKFDAEAYFDAIMKSYEDGSFANESIIKKANDKVRKRHSQYNYEKTVKDIMM